MKTFVDRDELLPNDAAHRWIIQAHQHLSGVLEHPVIEQAMSLTYRSQRNIRFVLNGLLLSEDITLRQIAERLSISERVVETYCQLFFNVRDRMEERAYIGAIVYPDGRMTREQVGGASSEERLLIAGYEEGAMAVLTMAGWIKRKEDKMNESEVDIADLIISNAKTDIREGNDNSAAVRRAMPIVIERERRKVETTSPDSKMGLTAVGLTYAVNETVKRIHESDLLRRLKELQREQEARQAAAAEGKKPT